MKLKGLNAMKGQKQKIELKKIVSLIFMLTIFYLLPFFIPLVASAQVTTQDLGLNVVGESTILPTTDIRLIVARIIQVVLGIIGVVSVVIIAYGGFLWMTSEGDQEKINQAKGTMKNWAIGLAIILLAFSIVTFLIRMIVGAPEGFMFGKPGTSFTYGRGALGNGIIESHYPPRGAHCKFNPPSIDGCVPRNTMIVVTFKEKMNLASFIAGSPSKTSVTGVANTDCPGLPQGSCVLLNNGKAGDEFKEWWEYLLDPNAVRIYVPDVPENQGKELPLGPDNALGLGQNETKKVYFRASGDKRTVLFVPADYIGTAADRYYYSVNLGNSIGKDNGKAAFSATGANSYYEWNFEVGPYIDITPPKVKNVYPTPGKTEARNVVVQINFSEAVNPLTTSGLATVDGANLAADSFNSLVVYQVLSRDASGEPTSTVPLGGTYTLSNQYQTAEFTTEPNGLCGTNSCGDDVFCLPADSDLDVVIKSASLSPNPPTADYNGSYDGVVDMAANSLNGNGREGDACVTETCIFAPAAERRNGCECAIGPAEDNFVWDFKTNNKIILDPPYLTDVDPGILIGNVDPAKRVKSLYSRLLMGRSLTSSNIALASDNKIKFASQTLAENLPFWISFENIDNDDDTDNYPDNQSQIYIDHDNFLKSEVGQSRYDYSLHFAAGVRDIYQNCYYPASAGPQIEEGCNYPWTSADQDTPSCCNDTLYNAENPNDACPRPLWIQWPAPAPSNP